MVGLDELVSWITAWTPRTMVEVDPTTRIQQVYREQRFVAYDRAISYMSQSPNEGNCIPHKVGGWREEQAVQA